MKIASIYSILFFLTYCSSPHNNYYFNLHQLKKIAQLSSIEPPPPAISFTPVYVIGINDSISETNFEKLQAVYKNLYTKRYDKFSEFLFDALNQKIKVDTHNPQTYLYFSQNFLSDEDVSLLYKERGVKGIIDKYCLNNNGSYILNKGALTVNEINSISYYFFISQYLRYDDDYHVEISFKNLSSVLK